MLYFICFLPLLPANYNTLAITNNICIKNRFNIVKITVRAFIPNVLQYFNNTYLRVSIVSSVRNLFEYYNINYDVIVQLCKYEVDRYQIYYATMKT